MRMLCTGGLGFIGSHLTDKLIEQGHHVVVLDDLSSGTLLNSNHKSEIHIGSILDRDLLDQLFKHNKFDYVFHLASQINLRRSIENPGEDAQTNILGSLAVIENCVKYKVKKIIFSSTGGAIYNQNQLLPFNENSSLKPISCYGLSKKTVEDYLEIIKNIKGLDYTILRFSNVFGTRQNAKSEAGVISIFIKKAFKGQDLIINGNGEQTRDFIDVFSVVDACILAKDFSGIYNVSSGTETSINYIANQIIKFTGSNSKLINAPAIPGEMIRCALDPTKIKNETGWKVLNDFDIELERTVKHKD